MEALKVAIFCVQMVAALLVFGSLVLFGVYVRPREVVLEAYETICMQAKNTNKGFFDYNRMETFLNTRGAGYYYGKWINPVSFLAIRLLSGGLGMALGFSLGILTAILFALGGFFLPDVLLEYLDKRDNGRMLGELDLVYSALSIQIRAGVYVTDALAECYGSVTHVRLREALQNLSGDIVMKADLDQALERFQGQFNNRYIDSLCITILQAMESGQAVELLGDIAEQIKDMEITLQHKKKEQLNRSATFYQLGIFALILALVLYACVVHLFSASIFFS